MNYQAAANAELGGGCGGSCHLYPIGPALEMHRQQFLRSVYRAEEEQELYLLQTLEQRPSLETVLH